MSLLAPEISGTDSSWDSMLIPQVSADMELSQNRDAWAEVVLRNVSDHESTESGARIITIDLTADESFVEISTRLRLLFLFINRAEFSNSATAGPVVNQSERSTSTTACMSSSSKC